MAFKCLPLAASQTALLISTGLLLGRSVLVLVEPIEVEVQPRAVTLDVIERPALLLRGSLQEELILCRRETGLPCSTRHECTHADEEDPSDTSDQDDPEEAVDEPHGFGVAAWPATTGLGHGETPLSIA